MSIYFNQNSLEILINGIFYCFAGVEYGNGKIKFTEKDA